MGIWDSVKGFAKDKWGLTDKLESDISRPYNNPNYNLKIYIGDKCTDPITVYLPEQVTFSSISKWSPFIPDLLGQTPLFGSVLKGAVETVDNFASGFGYQVNSRITKIKSWKGNEAPTFSFDFQFNAYESPLNEVVMPLLRLLSLTMPRNRGLMLEAPGPDLMRIIARTTLNALDSLAADTSISDKATGLANKGISAVTGAINYGSSALGFSKNLTSKTVDITGALRNLNSEKNRAVLKSIAEGNNKLINKDTNEAITLQIGKYMTVQNVVLTSIHPKIDSMFYGPSGLPVSAEASATFELLYPPTREELYQWFTGADSNRPHRSTAAQTAISSVIKR